MKNKILKNLYLLALIFALVISLAACGNNDNTNSDDKASSNDGMSQLESDLMPSQNNNSGTNSTNSQQNSQNGSNAQNSNNITSDTAKITKDEAKKIALKDANLKENEITNFEIELDRENNTLVYDISFDKGTEDYDYHIDANSGKIIKKDNDTSD
jgi:uncharacterized membrane protein YkoI